MSSGKVLDIELRSKFTEGLTELGVEGREVVDGENKTDVERCCCGPSARRHWLHAMTQLLYS